MTAIDEAEPHSTIAKLAHGLVTQRLTISRLNTATAVLLDSQREQLLTLNASALTVIEALEHGICTEEGLVQAVTQRFQADPAQVSADIRVFLSKIDATL